MACLRAKVIEDDFKIFSRNARGPTFKQGRFVFEDKWYRNEDLKTAMPDFRYEAKRCATATADRRYQDVGIEYAMTLGRPRSPCLARVGQALGVPPLGSPENSATTPE